MITQLITNINLWIIITIIMTLLLLVMIVFIIVLAKKTHVTVEFKSWIKGIPIALIFQENRYVDWKPIKPDAGIITDKDYGAFSINEKATYIDKKTKNVMIPLVSDYGASINIVAAKVAEDLQYVLNNQEEMNSFRIKLLTENILDSDYIIAMKTSINFGAIKNMVTALTPHNINAKIEKTIAQRLGGVTAKNIPNLIILFASVVGALILGGVVLYFKLKA